MKSSKPATLREIAQKVGVSTATVSVVLNGARSGTRVSTSTRDTILKAAADLNYRPNQLARSLRSQRSATLGFLYGYDFVDAANPFYAMLLAGISDQCRLQDHDLLLYTAPTRHHAHEVIGSILSGRVDALVMTAPPDHPVLDLAAKSHLPAVNMVDRVQSVPNVLVDDRRGGVLIAEHLAACGHRHVLYRRSILPLASVDDRYFAFRARAEELGMAISHGVPCDEHAPLSETDVDLLRAADGPTAIVAWDDAVAYATFWDLERRGFRVPEQMQVVGFNGMESFIRPRQRVTTVRAPFRRLAEEAVRQALAMVESGTAGQDVILEVELIPGDTTAPRS